MTNDQLVGRQQIIYHLPIEIVKKKLAQMKIIPATDIRIYDDYPDGWHATVGANDHVYIVTSYKGRLKVTTEPSLGFYSNGCLIRSPYFGNNKEVEGTKDHVRRGNCRADYIDD